MGVPLFERSTRGMKLTDHGRVALRYADRIFALGAELERSLRGDRSRALRVGVEVSIVAGTVRPMLARLTASSGGGKVVCEFASHDELLAGLKALELDIVLTTGPAADLDASDFVSRRVVQTEVAFFADAARASVLRAGFPLSLQDAPFIATPRTALREGVDRWLAAFGVRLAPAIELGDASLAAALAADGVGIIAAPLSAAVELRKRYELGIVGVAEGVRVQIHAVGTPARLEEHFEALTGEERPGDPVVHAVAQSAE
jgi:LysR family transcriptional activator of nhaA